MYSSYITLLTSCDFISLLRHWMPRVVGQRGHQEVALASITLLEVSHGWKVSVLFIFFICLFRFSNQVSSGRFMYEEPGQCPECLLCSYLVFLLVIWCTIGESLVRVIKKKFSKLVFIHLVGLSSTGHRKGKSKTE